jgi:hypothetical protein
MNNIFIEGLEVQNRLSILKHSQASLSSILEKKPFKLNLTKIYYF